MSDSTPTSDPIYNDRLTGENFPDASSMVNAYLRRFEAASGLSVVGEAKLDETGYAQLQRGSATVGVNVLEAHGVLMVFAPMMTVSPANREAFYRKLLELSFVATSDAAFAINAQRDEVVVRCSRRLSALDYEEFEDIITTVGDVADTWDGVLVEEFLR